MQTINKDELRLIRVNRGSVTVEYNGKHVFISKTIYNRILNGVELEGKIVTKSYHHPKTGGLVDSQWLAVLSIF